MAQAVSPVANGTPPTLSTKERDRRYALIREQLRERIVDCAVVHRSNLCYLTNGLPGERHALLPTADLPLTVAMHDRNLVDLPPDAFARMQDWVQDIRPGNDASPIVARVREIGAERGTIGLTDSTIGWTGLSHGIVSALQSAYPDATFVDVSDVFATVRTVKSDEELAMIEHANGVLDAGIEAVCRVSRPGMLGSRVVHDAIRAIWEAGGDSNSYVGFSCWPVPKRNHLLQDLTLRRTIEPDDVGILTGFVTYGHYTGHGDQTICFGPSKQLHREMFEGVRFVHDEIVHQMKPGATQNELLATYKRACEQTGFRTSTQAQVHPYGIDVPEFPWAGFAPPPGMHDIVLRAGMVYSIAPALTARDGEDTVIGGTSLAITADGCRPVGSPRMELLSIGD